MFHFHIIFYFFYSCILFLRYFCWYLTKMIYIFIIKYRANRKHSAGLLVQRLLLWELIGFFQPRIGTVCNLHVITILFMLIWSLQRLDSMIKVIYEFYRLSSLKWHEILISVSRKKIYALHWSRRAEKVYRL